MGETHITMSIKVQCDKAIWTGSVPVASYRELWFGDWFRYLYIQWTCIPVPVFMLKQFCQMEENVFHYLESTVQYSFSKSLLASYYAPIPGVTWVE